MGIFSFFTKDKKEDLDKGLEKTKEGLLGKLTRAIAGKSKVDEEVLDELENALIASDVGLETTIKIIKKVEERVAKKSHSYSPTIKTPTLIILTCLQTKNHM